MFTLTKLENGKYKKHYERAKTPCQRLLECPDIPEERKQILRMELQKQNPVALKKALDSAVDRLLHLNQEKAGKNIDNGGTLAEDAVVDGMYFG